MRFVSKTIFCVTLISRLSWKSIFRGILILRILDFNRESFMPRKFLALKYLNNENCGIGLCGLMQEYHVARPEEFKNAFLRMSGFHTEKVVLSCLKNICGTSWDWNNLWSKRNVWITSGEKCHEWSALNSFEKRFKIVE